MRAAENEEERTERLQNKAAHASQVRAAENEEERTERLQNKAAHASQVRAAENEEERTERLQNKAAHASQVRAAENEEGRTERLQNKAAHASQVRAAENEEERTERHQNMITRASQVRADQKEKVAKLKEEFPPVVDKQLTSACLSGFIEATSYSSISTVICGVCAVRCTKYEQINADELPGRELLLHENSGLTEYTIGDLLLHNYGVDDGMIVNCCTACLR